jgi:hypothetical protein
MAEVAKNPERYMTRDEQKRTLADSGFDPAAVVLERGGMALYYARAAAAPVPLKETPHDPVPDRHCRWLQKVSDFCRLPGKGCHRRLQGGRRAGKIRAGSGERRREGQREEAPIARRPTDAHDLRSHHRLG